MIVQRNYVGTHLNCVIELEEIFTIHYFEYVKHFHGDGEAHDFWEMVYVDCGHIEAIGDGSPFPLERGEACFHKPNEMHKIVSVNEFSSVFIVSFSTKSPDAAFLAGRIFRLDAWEKELISRILAEAAQVFTGALDIMDQTQLVRNSNAPYGGEQIIKMLVEQMLISIIGNNRKTGANSTHLQSRNKRQKEGSEEYIVDKVVHTLADNLYNRLTLDEICSQVMFSKSYVEKIFQNNMGCGIIQYFNRLKTNEAKRLISEGQHSFTEISDLLQFNSIHYFSRTFKAVVGMPPSAYAKSVKARGLL